MITYKILDGGLCFEKDIATLGEAKANAEQYIRTIPFGDLEDIEITKVDTKSDSIDGIESLVYTFLTPIIEWE